jgi:hypothetical protein
VRKEVLVLRTVGIFIAGVLLGVVVLGSLIWVVIGVIGLPQHLRIYAYYMADALTGTAVGLFVGFLQKRKAGLVALICLLPPVFLQYVNRYSQPATGLRLFLLLMGTAIELSIAFAIAHRLSKARRRAVSEISHA